MQNFVIGKKVVELSKVTGEVLSSDKFSETHVYSRGGGPLPGGGSSAPSVHSDVTTKQEFWIKTDDGSEKPIQLSGVDIPMRVGQKITVISAQRVGKKLRIYAALVNHTARDHWILRADHKFSNDLELVGFTGVSIVGSLVIGVLSYQVLLLTNIHYGQALFFAFCLGVAYIIYRFFKKGWLAAALGKKFIAHLNGIAKSMY